MAKGAEANIYQDQYLEEEFFLKRIPKGYRIKEIDQYLRKSVPAKKLNF